MTLCRQHFYSLNVGSLPPPPATASRLAVIKTYGRTSGVTIVHEMAHMFSRGKIISAHFPDSICITSTNIPALAEIIDQQCVLPPGGPGGQYTNRNWQLWTMNPNKRAYGYPESQFLGMARPNLGLLNAENYAMFAMCLTYQVLDCVSSLGNAIAKRESVPFQPSPEAVEQIRRGGSILLREDDEMETGRDWGNTFGKPMT